MVIPPELKLVLVALVTQGLKSLAAQFNLDISGQIAVIAVWIVGAVVAFAENGVAQLPKEWQPVVVGVVSLIQLVLGAMGLFDSVKGGTEKVVTAISK